MFVGVNCKLIKEKEVSLDKSFFTRNTNITAKVICDSISEQGVRLTTFEIEYPRIVMICRRMRSKRFKNLCRTWCFSSS